MYFLSNEDMILEYDLEGGDLALVNPPNFVSGFDGIRSITLIIAEDGGLGIAEILNSRLHLWSREARNGSDARWVQRRAIHLSKLLPIGALSSNNEADAAVLNYAEAANAIFVSMIHGLFTIELQSDRARKVYEHGNFYPLISLVSFYTPVPRGEHRDPLKLNQDLLKLNHSVPCEEKNLGEEAGGEGAAEDAKTIHRAQKLFDKRSNAIKEGPLSMT